MVEKCNYQCDNCKKEGKGCYITGGWYSYPLGWYIQETESKGSILVCSSKCADIENNRYSQVASE